MYMLRDFSYLSYPKIGAFLNRHHTTCMHGVQFVENERAIKPFIDIELDQLHNYINSMISYVDTPV